jgi:hypothetical protein
MLFTSVFQLLFFVAQGLTGVLLLLPSCLQQKFHLLRFLHQRKKHFKGHIARA